MKAGDIIRHKKPYQNKTYIVDSIDPKNDWVFVFGLKVPIQMSLMEVVSCAPTSN